MQNIWINLSIALGLFGFLWSSFKLRPKFYLRKANTNDETDLKKSLLVIIPCRNEEQNIANVLESLKSIPDNWEIVVVDDGSTDKTVEIAKSYPINLIKTPEKPQNWSGKSWACHYAINNFQNKDYVLFIDADTIQNPEKIQKALKFIQKYRIQMLASLPYHLNPKFWEKILGGFHWLVCFLTSPYSPPKPGRLYANGQFLMFETSFYKEIGGHDSVKSELAEDLKLAELTILNKGRFAVFPDFPLYQVRMYANFIEFIQGWKRNFNLGLKHTKWTVHLEIILFFLAVSGGGEWGSNNISAMLMVSTILLVGIQSRRLGNYPVWSILFAPVGIIVFMIISILSAIDVLFGRAIYWKGRYYQKLNNGIQS